MTKQPDSHADSQDILKTQVAHAALEYLEAGQIIGVGTGTTVNKFIEALGPIRAQVKGAVSSSDASTVRLTAMGIPILEANDVERLSVYIDGADEIDTAGNMIKGGGGALTREKIVAALADRFICIADQSKRVHCLGNFPLPVEVIPMASAHLQRCFKRLGGNALLRMKGGQPLVTDNGQHILDVSGLQIADPLELEMTISQWPGVLTVGIFAQQRAHVCLLGTDNGVVTLRY